MARLDGSVPIGFSMNCVTMSPFITATPKRGTSFQGTLKSETVPLALVLRCRASMAFTLMSVTLSPYATITDPRISFSTAIARRSPPVSQPRVVTGSIFIPSRGVCLR